jgi:lysozyme family protein
MTSLFNKCIDVVLQHEGGFQANENDLGNWVGGYKTGKLVGTKYGIAARFFPEEDIANLTIERAKYLYYVHYWTPMNLDGICREASALEVFDFGVNAGKRRAVRTAQKLCGVSQDGVVGPKTKYAINNYDGDFVKDYKHARRVYYEYIATKRDNHVFLQGWLNRVDKTHF